MLHNGQNYEVLQISSFDPEVDGQRRVVRTPVRAFDNKVALFTRRTRDLGFVRAITVRGRPCYILEPGADAVDWAADVEEVSVGELIQSTREGALGRRVARLARQRERQSRQIMEAQVQALRERAEDAEAEATLLRAELVKRERELARYGSH
jgi:hypothetical protein